MRMIDADALAQRLKEEAVNQIELSPRGRRDSAAMAFSDAWVMVNNAPTIDAVPVVRGEWIYSRTQSELAVSKCSVCGKEQFSISHIVKDGKYCPMCGAKMEDK